MLERMPDHEGLLNNKAVHLDLDLKLFTKSQTVTVLIWSNATENKLNAEWLQKQLFLAIP